jgi:hypothetical protein
MSKTDPNLWNISHSWTQPWRGAHWTDELDQMQLIMIAMDLMECDAEASDCAEAQEMLAGIGISC